MESGRYCQAVGAYASFPNWIDTHCFADMDANKSFVEFLSELERNLMALKLRLSPMVAQVRQKREFWTNTTENMPSYITALGRAEASRTSLMAALSTSSAQSDGGASG